MLISGATASDKSHSASGMGSAPLRAPWILAGCAGMFRERVHTCDLGRSPAGFRETDRGWSDRAPAVGQPSRAGACSPPGPSV